MGTFDQQAGCKLTPCIVIPWTASAHHVIRQIVSADVPHEQYSTTLQRAICIATREIAIDQANANSGLNDKPTSSWKSTTKHNP